MDRVLSALFTDENCSDELRFAYYLLSTETTHIEDKTVQNIVKNVKSLLSSSKTRYQGLLFLSKLLGRLSSDIFIENSSVLIQHVFKVLQESKDVEERILGYKVLTQFFAKIYRLDAQTLTRELGTCIIPLLTQCLANLKYADIYYASNWLCACSTLFPSPVSSKRSFLEIKIIEAVNMVVDENGDTKTLKALGFAYAKVMLAGNSNIQKYREFITKLLNTFVQYLNFYNVFPIKKPSLTVQFENDQCITQLYKEGSDIFLDPLKNAQKLRFLTAAICAVITGQFSGPIPLPVEGILECLNMFMLISNVNITDSHSVDVFAIGHVIPILYDNIFVILSALLTSCKCSLIPFTRLVNRIIVSTVEWLDQLKSIDKRLYLNLRCSVYSFIELYFSVIGSKVCFSKLEFQLIAKHLIENIKIHKQNITFSTSNNQMNTLVQLNANKELQEKSTLSAIQAINRVLSTMSTSLDPFVYNLFQTEVFLTLLHIYRGWFNLSSPYKNEKCRRELIEMLKLLLQNTPSTHSPPLETAITVFRQAYRIDKSPAIHCLIENCFNLVDFIMNSRFSANFTGVSVNQKSFVIKSLPLERLSTSNFNSVEEVNENIVSKIQKETTSVIKSSEKTYLKKSPDLELSSSVHGLKRKNEDSADSKSNFQKNIKPKAEVNLNDSDIIFEGVFERNEIAKSILKDVEKSKEELGNVQTLTTVKVPPQKALTTSIDKVNSPFQSLSESLENPSSAETTETSNEANDALRYFVVE